MARTYQDISVLSEIDLWQYIRSTDFELTAHRYIRTNVPEGVEIEAIVHLRSAHYGVYRVDAQDGSAWVVRIGVADSEEIQTVDNTAYLSTSTYNPSGQLREFRIAQGFVSSGASVCLPVHYAQTTDGYDLLWLPFVVGSEIPISARQWHTALTDLWLYRPDERLPVFTNRAKNFDRLAQLPDKLAVELGEQYDYQLQELFFTATHWSVVHGDAHSGNVFNINKQAVLFDFDTACWAPSVWDLTHLLNRAGTGSDTGYTVDELRHLFPFSDAEVAAACKLRQTATTIARAHQEASVHSK